MILLFSARSAGSDVPPLPYQLDRLENGLKVVAVPMAGRDVIAYTTIVRAGARNETEPGRTGFARLFQRLMSAGGGAIAGAAAGSFTTDDYTGYTLVFAGRENLEKAVKSEADRFINPAYSPEALRAAASTMEAEYRAGAADPDRRLLEALRDTAYTALPFKQTTESRLKDLPGLAKDFEYAQLFKKRFYAPDSTVLIVAGDFDPERLKALVRRYYGGWEKSEYPMVLPAEPAQTEPRRAQIAWPTAIRPRLAIGFHGPAYSDEIPDKAALNLLAEAAFSPISPLYRRLVLGNRKCLSLTASFPDSRAPGLLVISGTVRAEGDLPEVEREILKELERLKAEAVPAETLADVRSHLRRAVAAAVETPAGAVKALAPFVGVAGDQGALDRLFGLYDRLTPQNLLDAARKYFRTSSSTTVTLTAKEDQ